MGVEVVTRMSNVPGTWRCACEQDTAHIHVMVMANSFLELAICNICTSFPVLRQPAWAFFSSIQHKEGVGVEVVHVQCAMCLVRGGACVSRIRHISTQKYHPLTF